MDKESEDEDDEEDLSGKRISRSVLPQQETGVIIQYVTFFPRPLPSPSLSVSSPLPPFAGRSLPPYAVFCGISCPPPLCPPPTPYHRLRKLSEDGRSRPVVWRGGLGIT